MLGCQRAREHALTLSRSVATCLGGVLTMTRRGAGWEVEGGVAYSDDTVAKSSR
jgi:hypothetical protein